MSAELTSEAFPSVTRNVRGRWAPIYLSPILHSPERLVIAVAVVKDDDFHIEAANALNRLECLYGGAADTAIFAAQVALDELHQALSQSGGAALKQGGLVFSGVEIGEVRDGEATSLCGIGRLWMSAISSLYRFVPDEAHAGTSVDSGRDQHHDRLPILVLSQVTEQAPKLGQYFSDEIRDQRLRRLPGRAARISIDYAGPKFVANFATLGIGAPAGSVDRIKRKMFDLKVKQDNESVGLFVARPYEMILCTPELNSPFLSDRQVDRLGEAIHDLTEQSKREGFALQALHDVPEISRRVVTAEMLIQ